jgi:hypothetical protein
MMQYAIPMDAYPHPVWGFCQPCTRLNWQEKQESEPEKTIGKNT